MASLDFTAGPAPEPITAKPAREWSAYQQAIFDFVQYGSGNAIVKAVAGSGKTTTIVEAFDRCQGSALFLAFNKSIAEELKQRGVNARTFHSLTYSAVTKHKGVRQVETNKLRMMVDSHMSGEDSRKYGAFVMRMVGLGRQAGIGCLIHDIESNWLDLATHHDIELEDETADLGRALTLCSEILDISNACPYVDFDDLLYIAVKDGLSLPKHDIVFVDEAQDTNAIQRALLRKVLHPHSRVIAVGDPAQAIYGFRGADSNSMNLIASEFNCIELPLTVSYRCPQAVVMHAQKWVSHIEAAPGAPEGRVTDLGSKWSLSDLKQNDLIICRTSKPLIQMAFACLRARVPAKILGREIGQGMKGLVNRMAARSIEQLEDKLTKYMNREVEKALAKHEDAKIEAIEDRVNAILYLIDSLNENQRAIPVLLSTIDSLFESVDPLVTLSTVHKAKGLEADRVLWLNASRCPAKWARQEWQQQQERNLCYVATTRAKKELILIEERAAERPGQAPATAANGTQAG